MLTRPRRRRGGAAGSRVGRTEPPACGMVA